MIPFTSCRVNELCVRKSLNQCVPHLDVQVIFVLVRRRDIPERCAPFTQSTGDCPHGQAFRDLQQQRFAVVDEQPASDIIRLAVRKGPKQVPSLKVRKLHVGVGRYPVGRALFWSRGSWKTAYGVQRLARSISRRQQAMETGPAQTSRPGLLPIVDRAKQFGLDPKGCLPTADQRTSPALADQQARQMAPVLVAKAAPQICHVTQPPRPGSLRARAATSKLRSPHVPDCQPARPRSRTAAAALA